MSKSTTQTDIFFHCLDLTSEKVSKLQEEDATLSEIRPLAKRGSEGVNQSFFKWEGLYFRNWTPPGRGAELGVEQLEVPLLCRGPILKLAHEVPTAGHLGREKTA